MEELMTRASEISAFYASREDALKDRGLFVKNLGWLLSQTRDGVVGCEYDAKNDVVIIQYIGGQRRIVNIALDSYGAIIRDVAKCYQ